MAIRRVRPSKVLVGTQFSRRDFLKLSGTGLAGAALLGTAGCGSVFQGGGGQEERPSSATLNLNLTAEIPNWTPRLTTDTVSFDVLTNVMEGFYRLNLDNEPNTGRRRRRGAQQRRSHLHLHAEGWAPVVQRRPGDLPRLQVRLAQGAEPETAATYAYIISTFVKGADEYNTEKASAEDVAIETPDDKTLSVELIAKSPFFLQLTSFAIYFPQQQEFVEKLGDEYARDADSLLYNGPYIMTRASEGAGGTAVFKKNDKYWDKATSA